MSLSNLILDQPIILLAMLAAFLPVLAAMAIWLSYTLRQRRKNRPAKGRPAPARAGRGDRASAPSALAVADEPDAEAKLLPDSIPAPAAEVLPPAGDAPASGEKPGEDKTVVISSEIQNLLDSVFSDEETFERLKVRLKGADMLDIHDLLNLTNEVAAQLGLDNIQVA